jgi:hypothetical protein
MSDDVARLAERGAALCRLLAAGVAVDRLARVDRDVRHGRVTDWPGREPGPELRNGIPDLDVADREPPPDEGRPGRG